MAAAERLFVAGGYSLRGPHALAAPLMASRPWIGGLCLQRQQQWGAHAVAQPVPQQLRQRKHWLQQRQRSLQRGSVVAQGGLQEFGEDLREIRDDVLERVNKVANSISKAVGGGAASKATSSSGNGSSSSSSSSSSKGSPPPPPPPPPSTLNDWSKAGADEDWDAWSGSVTPDLDDEGDIAELREQIIERRRRRQGKRTRVRDEYLRPIVDAQGIYNRLTYDEREAEERVFVEAITNQYESKEALIYTGWLIAIPLAVGFLVSRLVAQPLWDFAERLDPQVFELSEEQMVEGAHEIRMEEVRIRMEASLGRAPPLSDEDMIVHLAKEARHIAEEMREGNKQALLNIVSDSTSATVLFLMLLQDTVRRQLLFRTIGRVFSGMSDTAKAFLIILTTDILLGYHSEEGWTAFLKITSRHYGVEPEMEGIYIFVSTVPVFLDTCFKYWIFVGLNKDDPAAAVTLKQMDRH